MGTTGETNEFVGSLRQLLSSVEPIVREAESLGQAEEQLLQLEARDSRFHKYELVRQLKKRIREYLEPVMSSSVEQRQRRGSQGGLDTLVETVTKDVLDSKEFSSMMKDLRLEITDAVKYIEENLRDDPMRELPGLTSYHRYHARGPRQSTTSILSMGSSLESSMNQGSMFLSQEQAAPLADNLQKSKSIELRRDAMSKLLRMTPLECVGWDEWKNIQKSVIDALADKDERLSSLALRFCARGLSTLTVNAKEIFVLLCEYLQGVFKSRRSPLPKVGTQLNLRRPELAHLVKAFRLLNQFQQEVPTYWVRFSERFVEDMVRCTVELLAMSDSSVVASHNALLPLHYMALVDPHAKWFQQWIHAYYSRSYLLSALQDNRSFVETAVRHLVEFAGSRTVPIDAMSDISEAVSRASYAGKDGAPRLVYSGQDLEYLSFVHCINVVGRVLFYVHGRDLFPVQLRERATTVDVTQLLRTLITLMIKTAGSSRAKRRDDLDPALLVRDFLLRLASCEQTYAVCLCNDNVTMTLLKPIHDWLDNLSRTKQETAPASERALLCVADVLSVVAASSLGKRHLLYGETTQRYIRIRTAAAQLLAEFSQKALDGTLPAEFAPPPSPAVIGAFVYISRQLYSTCEGLLSLSPFKLHRYIAEAWSQEYQAAQDENATPTPSLNGSEDDEGGGRAQGTYEEALRDNLLNFASTPKGLLQVEQTGALRECVSYMYARYEKKLQVSKNEKFGYGTMVTQIAGTAPGIQALKKTGFLAALLLEVWNVLETADTSVTNFLPHTWPVSPLDRSAQKPFTTVLNVLSGFPGVYELLWKRPRPRQGQLSFRSPPTTIVDLIDRTVLLDSDEKIHFLFNPEQSHVFGLRVLSGMVSCLDTFLLLESQYHVQEVLLNLQKENKHEETQTILIDMSSVERNYILVKTYLVGGPSERRLPDRTVFEGSHQSYPYQLFAGYPVPKEYISKSTSKASSKAGRKGASRSQPAKETVVNALTKCLENKASPSSAWLQQCRDAFSSVLRDRPEQLRGAVLMELLDATVEALIDDQHAAIFPLLDDPWSDSAMNKVKLSSAEQLGVEIAIRYGSQLGQVSSLSEAGGSLTHLLKQCHLFFRQQQKKPDSSLQFLQGDYPGFDWFASSVFLLMGGGRERAWSLLHQFSCLITSAYMWLPRLHNSMHLPPALTSSGIPPLFSSTGHNLELLLQAELPVIASAFLMSGFTPTQICCHWLRQCFWNFLDWPDICHYICTCVVMGVDYQVYMCVAVLKHLRREILLHHQRQDLAIFLKEEPIRGFHVSDYIDYMRELEGKFRSIVLTDMQNLVMS